MTDVTTGNGKRVHRRQGVARHREERHRLTRARAERQAERIRAYWEAEGQRVRVWIEPLEDSSTEWVVRSTLELRVKRP